MPKIDPDTGVLVLTFGEFIVKQAEHEGITPSELIDDIARQMREAEEEEIKRLRENALSTLNDAIKEQNNWVEVPMPFVETILEVMTVEYTFTFRESHSKIVARCKMQDGSEHTVEFSCDDLAGSYYVQPEREMVVDYV